MNIIGFFFTKLHAHKSPSFKKGLSKTTNIEVTDIQKDEAPFTTKNSVVKVTFRNQILYMDPAVKKDNTLGEVTLEGNITLMLTENEAKDLLKDWKKKEVSISMKQALFNFILRKCSPKALELEDSVNLPLHIPMPQIKVNSNASQKD